MLIDYHEVLRNLNRGRITVSEAFEIYNEKTEQIKKDLDTGINIVNKQIEEIAGLKKQKAWRIGEISRQIRVNNKYQSRISEKDKQIEKMKCCTNCGVDDIFYIMDSGETEPDPCLNCIRCSHGQNPMTDLWKQKATP